MKLQDFVKMTKNFSLIKESADTESQKCFGKARHNKTFDEAISLLMSFLEKNNLSDYSFDTQDINPDACSLELVSLIKKAQENLKIEQDGVLGWQTIQKMEQNLASEPKQKMVPDEKTTPSTGPAQQSKVEPVQSDQPPSQPQSIKQGNIEDRSRPVGATVYVSLIEQNLQTVEDFCKDILNIDFSFTTDGIKNFQKSVGFAGETKTFDLTTGGKKNSRTIEGQIDGKIGPHTMTAFTLLYFINGSGQDSETAIAINPNKIFESSSLSLKERLENNLRKLSLNLNEAREIASFEDFANTDYFKSRVAPTHTSMKVQNPSIPPLTQVNLPFDTQSLIEKKYEIYKGIGINKKYSEDKRGIIKLFIDAIIEQMPPDAHSKQAIIALLSVCGKESGFVPKMAESAAYSYNQIKANKKGDAVANRVHARFLDPTIGPGRPPTDEELRAITGGGRNGPALFNIAYGYSKYNKNARLTNEDKLLVNGKINPKLYDPNGPGYKYRGHGMVQMTFKGNYEQLEKLARKEGGELADMFAGVSNDPGIILKTPEHNVLASIMYMNFPHAKNAINGAKQKEGETEMEFLVRKYASGPFGSTIGQGAGPRSQINGQINLSAASKKTADFIIVEE